MWGQFFTLSPLPLCVFSSLPGYFILSLTFLRPYIFWNVHDSSTFCENIKGCLKSCSEMPVSKLSSCFEYRGLMIVSKYFVGGGLWRLLNINLFITSARPLKSIFSLFWLYIWDHYVYIHNLCKLLGDPVLSLFI
jgi:hypothetical protein